MTKDEFLSELKLQMEGLPEKDIKEAVAYYSEIIDDSMEDGTPEEDAVAALGDVGVIAAGMKSSQSENASEGKKHRFRKFTTLEIVCLIVGFPIWISVFAVALSLYIVAIAINFSFYAVAFSMVVSGISALVASVVGFVTNNPAALFILGAGLIVMGLGIFLFIGMNRISIGFGRLSVRMFKGIKSFFFREG